MVSSGFFNSIGGDRKYTNEQLSSIISTLVTDGVFQHWGEKFYTVPVSGMEIGVKPGFAWFDDAWIRNDALLVIKVPIADVSLSRYDAIVIEMNTTPEVREGTIKLISGTPASSPVKPALINNKDVHQHLLAYIKVTPSVTAIQTKDIEIVVGLEACPFVTGILATTDITEMFNQWDGEFQTWFDNIQAQLSGDIATNLQRQIDERVKIADKATDSEARAGTVDTKWMTPLKTYNFFNSKKASASEVISGINQNKWVSPYTLKQSVSDYIEIAKLEELVPKYVYDNDSLGVRYFHYSNDLIIILCKNMKSTGGNVTDYIGYLALLSLSQKKVLSTSDFQRLDLTYGYIVIGSGRVVHVYLNNPRNSNINIETATISNNSISSFTKKTIPLSFTPQDLRYQNGLYFNVASGPAPDYIYFNEADTNSYSGVWCYNINGSMVYHHNWTDFNSHGFSSGAIVSQYGNTVAFWWRERNVDKRYLSFINGSTHKKVQIDNDNNQNPLGGSFSRYGTQFFLVYSDKVLVYDVNSCTLVNTIPFSVNGIFIDNNMIYVKNYNEYWYYNYTKSTYTQLSSCVPLYDNVKLAYDIYPKSSRAIGFLGVLSSSPEVPVFYIPNLPHVLMRRSSTSGNALRLFTGEVTTGVPIVKLK